MDGWGKTAQGRRFLVLCIAGLFACLPHEEETVKSGTRYIPSSQLRRAFNHVCYSIVGLRKYKKVLNHMNHTRMSLLLLARNVYL